MTHCCGGGGGMMSNVALNGRWEDVCGRMILQSEMVCELAGKKVCEKDPS